MIIAIDVSGNWNEGKGTTGLCYADKNGKLLTVNQISATDYKSPEAYWNAHLMEIKENSVWINDPLEVVMEGFRLYSHKKNEQVNSQFETPQVIGVIRHWCYANGVPLKIQFASEVKTRWSDKVLEAKGIIEVKNKIATRRYFNGQLLNNHKTDAIRHMMHYISYNRS